MPAIAATLVRVNKLAAFYSDNDDSINSNPVPLSFAILLIAIITGNFVHKLKKAVALWDPGAQVSLMDYAFYLTLPNAHKTLLAPSPYHTKFAAGSGRTKLIGKARILVYFVGDDNKAFPIVHTFHICPDLFANVLLGKDITSCNRILLQSGEKVFMAANEVAPKRHPIRKAIRRTLDSLGIDTVEISLRPLRGNTTSKDRTEEIHQSHYQEMETRRRRRSTLTAVATCSTNITGAQPPTLSDTTRLKELTRRGYTPATLREVTAIMPTIQLIEEDIMKTHLIAPYLKAAKKLPHLRGPNRRLITDLINEFADRFNPDDTQTGFASGSKLECPLRPDAPSSRAQKTPHFPLMTQTEVTRRLQAHHDAGIISFHEQAPEILSNLEIMSEDTIDDSFNPNDIPTPKVILGTRLMNACLNIEKYRGYGPAREAKLLHKTKWASTIVFIKPHLSLEAGPSLRRKTCFTTPSGSVMTFNGLTAGLGPTMTHWFNHSAKIFGHINHTTPTANGILLTTTSRSFQKHANSLRELLITARHNHLRIDPHKSILASKTFKYNAMLYNCETPPNTMEGALGAFLNFPAPLTQAALRSFVSQAIFYELFAGKDAEQHLKLLIHHTNINYQGYKLTPEISKAVSAFKAAVLKARMAYKYDNSKPLIAYSDASTVSAGFAVAQVLKETPKPQGKEVQRIKGVPNPRHQLAVLSTSSTPFEGPDKYKAIIQKESLALLWGITANIPFFLGRKDTTVYIDAIGLLFLSFQRDQAAMSLLRLAWLLSAYDITAVHLPGLENGIPDSLSRHAEHCSPKILLPELALTEKEAREVIKFVRIKDGTTFTPQTLRSLLSTPPPTCTKAKQRKDPRRSLSLPSTLPKSVADRKRTIPRNTRPILLKTPSDYISAATFVSAYPQIPLHQYLEATADQQLQHQPPGEYRLCAASVSRNNPERPDSPIPDLISAPVRTRSSGPGHLTSDSESDTDPDDPTSEEQPPQQGGSHPEQETTTQEPEDHPTDTTPADTARPHVLSILKNGTLSELEFAKAQAEDPHLRRILDDIEHQRRPTHRSDKHYTKENNLLYKDMKHGIKVLALPESLLPYIFWTHHHTIQDQHPSPNKMARSIESRYHMPNLKEKLRGLVATCWLCTKQRVPRIRKHTLASRDIPDTPGHTWAIDFAMGWGKDSTTGDLKVLQFAVDAHSRYVVITPQPNRQTQETITALKTGLINPFGCPRILRSDQDAVYTSNDFKKFLADNKIKHETSGSHNPESQAEVETIIAYTKDAMKLCWETHPHYDFATLALIVATAYNKCPQSYKIIPEEGEAQQHHFFTPEYLHYGYSLPSKFNLIESTELPKDPKTFAEEVLRTLPTTRTQWKRTLIKERLSRIKHLNKSRSTRDISIGDLVTVKRQAIQNASSLTPGLDGPFYVNSTSNSRATLQDARTGHLFNESKSHIYPFQFPLPSPQDQEALTNLVEDIKKNSTRKPYTRKAD